MRNALTAALFKYDLSAASPELGLSSMKALALGPEVPPPPQARFVAQKVSGMADKLRGGV